MGGILRPMVAWWKCVSRVENPRESRGIDRRLMWRGVVREGANHGYGGMVSYGGVASCGALSTSPRRGYGTLKTRLNQAKPLENNVKYR